MTAAPAPEPEPAKPRRPRKPRGPVMCRECGAPSLEVPWSRNPPDLCNEHYAEAVLAE